MTVLMRKALCWAGLIEILGLGAASVLAFQPPLTTVQAFLVTNDFDTVVHYIVYDPELGSFQEGSHRYRGSSFQQIVVANLTVGNGIVAWRVYDTGQFATLDTEIRFAVYDPARTAWLQGARRWEGSSISAWAVTNLTVSNGLIAWRALPRAGTSSLDTAVGFATYDPANGTWIQKENLYEGTSLSYWVTTNLTVANGMLTWRAYNDGLLTSYDTEVAYTVYDPLQAVWATERRLYDGRLNYPWTIYGLAISNQLIRWAASNALNRATVEVRGYDAANGLWQSTPTLPLAHFVAGTKPRGQAAGVWFTDMSLGGSSWSWNFGDGATSTERSPYHPFSEAGDLTISQTVTGPGGVQTAFLTMYIDLEPPTGSITINGGATNTSNPEVSLLLLASDNSGSVATMRFSNDQNIWSDWTPYADNRLWLLTTGYGLKTVSVQFQDAVGNISDSYSDTIILEPFIQFDSSSLQISGGAFHAQLTGVPDGTAVVIQSSSNLVLLEPYRHQHARPGAGGLFRSARGAACRKILPRGAAVSGTVGLLLLRVLMGRLGAVWRYTLRTRPLKDLLVKDFPT